MANKKDSSDDLDKLKEFGKKIMNNQIKNSIVGAIKEKINEFKKQVAKSIAFIVFMIFGICIVFVGLSEYLASVFPILSQGIGYILFGLILIIIALVIKISK